MTAEIETDRETEREGEREGEREREGDLKTIVQKGTESKCRVK